jgi:hypothetical protein
MEVKLTYQLGNFSISLASSASLMLQKQKVAEVVCGEVVGGVGTRHYACAGDDGEFLGGETDAGDAA